MTPAQETAITAAVRQAGTEILGGDAQQCSDHDLRQAERIATRSAELLADLDLASIIHRDAKPAKPRSCLFVRQTRFVPVEVAARFDVVIVCARIESSSKPGRVVGANRGLDWYQDVRMLGTEVVLWDWMVPPTLWREGLEDLVAFAAKVGAIAVCLNVEPASKYSGDKHTARDWRGKRRELATFATTTRDLCDARRLELWVTSWADPPRSFGLPELVRPAHVCIPQPYEVHGRAGEDYVAEVLAEWRDAGMRRCIIGRGAHENDKTDDDSWRTVAEIEAHRESTPAGMDEAWWVPRGSLKEQAVLVDAMVA